jgi:hypothetical protein
VRCAQLSTRVCAGLVVAALSGELDIVDALGALVGVVQQARTSGVEVVLAAPHDTVARTLALTGIGEAFRIYGSVPDAVAANNLPAQVAGADRAVTLTAEQGRRE